MRVFLAYCSSLVAGGCLILKNLDVLVSLDPVVLPFSHTLSSSHSLSSSLPSFPWQPGPSGLPEGVSVCAERRRDGRFDRHTEV